MKLNFYIKVSSVDNLAEVMGRYTSSSRVADLINYVGKGHTAFFRPDNAHLIITANLSRSDVCMRIANANKCTPAKLQAISDAITILDLNNVTAQSILSDPSLYKNLVYNEEDSIKSISSAILGGLGIKYSSPLVTITRDLEYAHTLLYLLGRYHEHKGTAHKLTIDLGGQNAH